MENNNGNNNSVVEVLNSVIALLDIVSRTQVTTNSKLDTLSKDLQTVQSDLRWRLSRVQLAVNEQTLNNATTKAEEKLPHSKETTEAIAAVEKPTIPSSIKMCANAQPIKSSCDQFKNILQMCPAKASEMADKIRKDTEQQIKNMRLMVENMQNEFNLRLQRLEQSNREQPVNKSTSHELGDSQSNSCCKATADHLIREFSSEVENINGSIKKLETQMQKSSQNSRNQEQKIRSWVQDEIADAMKKVSNDVRSQIGNFGQTVKKLESEYKSTTMLGLAKSVTDLNNAVGNLRKEFKTLSDRQSEATRRLRAYIDSEVGSTRNKLVDLQREFAISIADEKKSRISDIQSLKTELCSKMANSNKGEVTLEKDNEATSTTPAEIMESLKELRSMCDKYSSDVSDLRNEINSINSRVSTSEKINASSDDLLKTLSSHLQILDDKIHTEGVEKLTALEAKIKDIEEKVEKVSQQSAADENDDKYVYDSTTSSN